MFYRVILAIEQLEDGTTADDINQPINDENVHTMGVLAIEQSFAVADSMFQRILKQEEGELREDPGYLA